MPNPDQKAISKEDQPEIRVCSGVQTVSMETTESENTEQPLLLTMLLKKDKQAKRKSSIDIIREEMNLEEMDTNKAQNDNFKGYSEFGALLEKQKKPQKKSSIERIRDEIQEDINNDDEMAFKCSQKKDSESIEDNTQQQQQQKESFSLFKDLNFQSAIQLQQQPEIMSPQLIEQSSLNFNKISPPPGLPLPQKSNQGLPQQKSNIEDPFQIQDFNYLNNNNQSNNNNVYFQQPGMEIIRSNSEQQGLIRQFSMNKQLQNLQQNGIQNNNTPSSIRKKKLRLESDQFINNSPQTPQPLTQHQLPPLPSQPSPFSYNSQSPTAYISPLQMKNAAQSQFLMMSQKSEKRKPLILSETNIRYYGTVKFFDDIKGYGFIIVDQDNSEVFFHMDDIQQPHVTKEYIMTYKKGNIVRFSFSIMHYIGKYNQSVKATEIQLIQPF